MLDARATAHALRSRHSRWVYVLPILHLSVCALSFVGFVMPTLQSLAIAFEFLWVADLPFSIVGFILAWQHPILAMIWMIRLGSTYCKHMPYRISYRNKNAYLAFFGLPIASHRSRATNHGPRVTTRAAFRSTIPRGQNADH